MPYTIVVLAEDVMRKTQQYNVQLLNLNYTNSNSTNAMLTTISQDGIYTKVCG